MVNHGFVRCTIANFEGELSNLESNTSKILEIMQTAANAGTSILALPELCLTGYSCQDLFLMSNLSNVQHYLNILRSSSYDYPSLLTLVGCPVSVNGSLYNCAVAICAGSILGVVPKQYIPNYDEFYEKRWFQPYTDFNLTEIDLFGDGNLIPFGNLIFSSSLGYQLGVEICEDLWSVIPPSSYLALSGANIIANLSASNELVGKDEYRRELIKGQSARTISAYLYASSSGFLESSSDLVFGGSLYAYENGKKITSTTTDERFLTKGRMETFDVDVEYLTNQRLNNQTFSDSKRVSHPAYKVVHFKQYRDVLSRKHILRFINPHPFVPNIQDEAGSEVCREIMSIQSTALARRLSAIGCKKVTIGISGGLDSTLALLVCVEAFKKLNLSPKGIIGVTMPGFGTTNRTYHNSINLCTEIDTAFREVNIQDACLQHFKDIGHDPKIHDITYENVQARERTQILMDLANNLGAILVGTGDLSELVLGWCTYNGDHMSMYGVNCSIPKTLVKHLIEWYARFCCEDREKLRDILLDIIDTPISPELLPSDGTEIVQKTENDLGPYELFDFFLYHFLRNRFDGEKIVFLAQLAFQGKYKEDELIMYYNRFISRFFKNQFKRNCIPDGPKVGSVSVSPRGDLRMPSDANCSNWLIS